MWSIVTAQPTVASIVGKPSQQKTMKTFNEWTKYVFPTWNGINHDWKHKHIFFSCWKSETYLSDTHPILLVFSQPQALAVTCAPQFMFRRVPFGWNVPTLTNFGKTKAEVHVRPGTARSGQWPVPTGTDKPSLCCTARPDTRHHERNIRSHFWCSSPRQTDMVPTALQTTERKNACTERYPFGPGALP